MSSNGAMKCDGSAAEQRAGEFDDIDTSGPEQLHDTAGPTPVSTIVSMFETTEKSASDGERRTAGLEQFDEIGPTNIVHEAIPAKKKLKNDTDNNSDVPLELMPPAPLNPSMLEHEDDVHKKVTADITVAGNRRDMQTQEYARSDDVGVNCDEISIKGEEEIVDGQVDGTFATNEDGDVEQQHVTTANSAAVDNRFQRDSSVSIPGITEAYAVDDDVIVATPAEPDVPFWKQRRVRILLSLAFLAVAVFAIALGVSLSRRGDTVTQIVVGASSIPPTQSTVPSLQPTDLPSTSQIPSSSPSECSYQIYSTIQKLDLRSPSSDMPKFALDGKNLVVISSDVGSVTVVFFSLTNDDIWERAGYFIEANVDWSNFQTYSVSLSVGINILVYG